MALTFDQIKTIVNIHAWRNITYIELYKKFFAYVMDRQQELDKALETKWMSNVSSPILYMLCMAVFWMYQDSKTAFEVYRKIKKAKWEWLTEEEKAAYDEQIKDTKNFSNQIIDLFEHIYDTCDWSVEFDMSVLDAIILGNGFWWIWFEKSEEVYEVTDKDWKKTKVIEKVALPNIFRIIPLNFYTEFSANSQKSAKINVVRFVMNEDRIKAKYKIYWCNYVAPTERKDEDIIESKDWNMVLRYIIFNNMPFVTTRKNLLSTNPLWGWWDTNIIDSLHTDIWTDNNFKIWKDLHEVYEVHTDKTIQIFVDWKNEWVFPRLWPWKVKPFYKLSFRDWLNWLYDLWVWYLWYNLHKVIDGFLNMRIDQDRLLWTSPLLVNSDDTVFDWIDYLQQYPWKLIKVKDVKNVQPLNQNSVWSTIANNEVDQLSKTVQDSVWVSWYKLWIQQKVERSKWAVDELIQSTDAAMKSFIGSVAKAKWFISKYITLLAIEYMDKADIEEITWSSDLQEKFDINDFVREYSINFNIQSISSLRERQELETIKWIIRDYSWMTRPNWTPIMNQEVWFKYVLEKSWAPEDLFLSSEKSFEYMKEQVKQNAELKKLEATSMPQPTIPWSKEQVPWIVPDAWVQPMTVWAAPTPWVQSWWTPDVAGEARNPLWNNQTI